MLNRTRNYDLISINILSILLIIVISFIHNMPLRIIVGLPFILFFPGYTFIAATFTKSNSLNNFTRIALSFAFSIVISSLIGIILNYAWNIGLYPTLTSLAIFVFLISVIAWCRRSRTPNAFSLNIRLPHFNPASYFLSLLVLIAIGSLAFTMGFPKTGEKFTEFYILGLDGKADNYPRELAVDEQGGIIVGIINREHADNVSYCIEAKVGNESIGISNPIILNNNEKWEQPVELRLWEAGTNQKVEFVLYKGDIPYRELHLWLNVY